MNIGRYSTAQEQEVYTLLQTTEQGLSQQEVAARQKKDGFNELKKQETTAFSLFARQFKSPFIILLLGAATISFFLEGPHNALIISAIVALNTLLGFYQEYSAHKTLQLLKQYLIRQVRVRRAGIEYVIPARELISGDIVLLEAGDILAADVRLVHADSLMVDESVLTGESQAVNKTAAAVQDEPPDYMHANNLAFSGTTVTNGSGVGVVFATGQATIFGSIAQLAVPAPHIGAFERDIAQFSAFVLRVMILILLSVIIINFILKGSSINIVDLIMFALALALGITPEALPVVTTVTLARGAHQLAKRKVVVKRLSAIDDLGSIQVLCTDKTGTLTENKLSVVQTNAPNVDLAILYATLASPEWAWRNESISNPFDVALWQYTNDEQRRTLTEFEKLGALPFTPERRRTTVVVKYGPELLVIARGSLDTIEQCCAQPFDTQAHAWEIDQGKQSNRVLAIAYKKVEHAEGAIADHETNLMPVGLIAFTDPIKPTATSAVDKAKKMGVVIKILTGDTKEVADVVARQIGLIQSGDQVITGTEFAQLSATEQENVVERCQVFARILPEQKFRIIQLLQKKYDVGFLGDGINDAPALKIANVAMAVQGAQAVAQEAADIILLKKSLRVIVDGIHEGRTVFTNTKKYILVTLSCNFGNILTIAVASFFIDYLPMLPVQILLVNLLSDFPMIMIATDTVDHGVLQKPTSFSIKSIALLALIMGALSSLFDCIFFWYFNGLPPAVVQTNWFIDNAVTATAFIFAIRTRLPFYKATRPSAWLMLLAACSATVAVVLPLTALGQRLFYFVPPTATHYMVITGILIGYFFTTEVVKMAYFKVRK